MDDDVIDAIAYSMAERLEADVWGQLESITLDKIHDLWEKCGKQSAPPGAIAFESPAEIAGKTGPPSIGDGTSKCYGMGGFLVPSGIGMNVISSPYIPPGTAVMIGGKIVTCTPSSKPAPKKTLAEEYALAREMAYTCHHWTAVVPVPKDNVACSIRDWVTKNFEDTFVNRNPLRDKLFGGARGEGK